MRSATVSLMKGTCHKHLNDQPREGSKLRAVYELFYASKGVPVLFKQSRQSPYQLEILRNFYGLDIRRICNGKYVLAGEWFGRVYVDYIAERIKGAA